MVARKISDCSFCPQFGYQNGSFKNFQSYMWSWIEYRIRDLQKVPEPTPKRSVLPPTPLCLTLMDLILG